MRVVLAYDEVAESTPSEELREDFGAEYDDECTIEALLAAIQRSGHEAVALALEVDFGQQIRRLSPDLVFNIAEGVRGACRESIVPAWLDHLGIPYTGSDGLTLAIGLDKALTKTLAATRGVRTPPFRRVGNLADLETLDLDFPLFVKPNAEGSSMGIRRSSAVRTPEKLRERVAWVLDHYGQDCLIEQFAPGREFCIGILGNGEPALLPIVELRSPGGFYCYEHKSSHRTELRCPAEVSGELDDEMRRMASDAFRVLRCRDLARVDLKLDAAGRPTFLEINPLPGLSPHYGIFPHQARAGGVSYDDLIARVMERAVQLAHNRSERIVV